MNELPQWLLAGSSVCLLAGWLIYRAFKRADAEHKRVKAEAAAATALAAAQRELTEKAARRHLRQKAAEQAAARAATARLAHAEAARVAAEAAVARAEAVRLAAAEAARVRGVLAAQQAAAAEAVRLAVEEAARAQAARLAADKEALDRDARAAAAARLEAEPRATTPAIARSVGAVAPKTPDETLIMVADDSKVVRVKTGRLLAQHQYRVSYATDGLDAAQQMQTNVPDVVITDVEMPGMDGFALTRHVRLNPLTAHIPVIMITAADDRHREDASRAGVSVLLGKPYPEEELIAHIRRAMKQGQAEAGRLPIAV